MKFIGLIENELPNILYK